MPFNYSTVRAGDQDAARAGDQPADIVIGNCTWHQYGQEERKEECTFPGEAVIFEITGPFLNENSWIAIPGRRIIRSGGVIHCADGPAITIPGIGWAWFKGGLLHRVGKPAVEFENGSRIWALDGVLAREGGRPVARYADGGWAIKCAGGYMRVGADKYTDRVIEDFTREECKLIRVMRQVRLDGERALPMDVLVHLICMM